MGLSMTRYGPSAHPRGAPWRLALLGLALTVLLGAAEFGPPRPAGTSHAEAVAVALELALVASGDGAPPAAGMDEARDLLREPGLVPAELRAAALEAGRRWAGRVDPARRLWLDWKVLGDPAGRLVLMERPDPTGSLARLAAVAAFCEALLGSRHLPVAQAEELIALAAGQRDAEAALALAGGALEGMTLRTGTAQRQVALWREVLAVARLPGPLPWETRLAARGQALDQPLAVLLRVEEARVVLGSRALLSWRDGALVKDAGPSPDALERWSSEAWRRWRVIARRRGAVVLAGVTTLSAPGSAVEALDHEPLLVVDPGLPAARVAEVLGWLAGEGERRACLLAREPEGGGLRRLCFGIAREPIGPGWSQPALGATAQDLARELEAGGEGVVVPFRSPPTRPDTPAP